MVPTRRHPGCLSSPVLPPRAPGVFLTTKFESIREFDVDSQISFRKAEHVNLILTEAEGAETLRDWIKPGDLVITAPFCKERGNVCILTSPPENAAGEEDFSLAIHDNPLGSFEAGDFVMQEMRRELAERQIREWLDRKWNVSMFFPNEGEEERFRDICARTPSLLSITPLRGELPAGFGIPGSENGRPLFLGTVRQVPVRYGAPPRQPGRQGAQGTRAGIPERHQSR